jgi:hypothetical protein
VYAQQQTEPSGFEQAFRAVGSMDEPSLTNLGETRTFSTIVHPRLNLFIYRTYGLAISLPITIIIVSPA